MNSNWRSRCVLFFFRYWAWKFVGRSFSLPELSIFWCPVHAVFSHVFEQSSMFRTIGCRGFYWRSFWLLLVDHFDLYSTCLTNFDSNWAFLHPLTRRWCICAVNESLLERCLLFIFLNFFILFCDRILPGGRMLQMMVSVQFDFLPCSLDSERKFFSL